MADIHLSLVSHTNAGKTTLARTLLGRDVGEVRDAPHVTEFADRHELIASAQGDRLWLWDTPGFGDSARLLRRLRQSGQPWGWLLSQVWDRWRDHAFWASQQVLRHAQAESDVLLYVVSTAEAPAAAGYIEPEMELLAWLDKPVLVLLNQLGAPRAAAEEDADLQAWRAHLARWPRVRAVLPLDAFARCWVHEQTLLRQLQALLDGERAAAMARLADAWQARQTATFDAAMQALAQSLARTALAREAAPEAAGLGERLRRIGATLRGQEGEAPDAQAQERLAAALDDELRDNTARLLALHGLQGGAQGEILARVASQFALHPRLPEGRAALAGGALSGALLGLKADVLSGGLTLGGGLLAGGILGALGAAGLARGINRVRGTDRSWVAWDDAAMAPLVQAALLRYLAVAHFGRGRGNWVQGEAPPHWPAVVDQALAAQAPQWAALWQGRGQRLEVEAGEPERLAQALQPLLAQAALQVLGRLYPAADNPPP